MATTYNTVIATIVSATGTPAQAQADFQNQINTILAGANYQAGSFHINGYSAIGSTTAACITASVSYQVSA